jgi:hypothetical protein
MRHSCEQIQNAVISGISTLSDNDILIHLDRCSECQRALELPDEIAAEIGNINLLGAPHNIHDTVMATLQTEKSSCRDLRFVRYLRIGMVSAVYFSLIIMIISYWNPISSLSRGIIVGFRSNFNVNISALMSNIDTITQFAINLGQSPFLLITVLMSATLLWSHAIINIRDTLKN